VSQSEEESTTLQLHLKASIIIAREGIWSTRIGLCALNKRADLNEVMDIFQVSSNELNNWVAEPQISVHLGPSKVKVAVPAMPTRLRLQSIDVSIASVQVLKQMKTRYEEGKKPLALSTTWEKNMVENWKEPEANFFCGHIFWIISSSHQERQSHTHLI
jgi:hypothetical protein